MKIQDFDNQLASTNNLADAEKILTSYLKTFNILSFAFTYYQDHIKTGRKLIYDYASPPIAAFHRYYLERGYANIDRTLENISQTTLPVFWQVNKQVDMAKNNLEKELRQVALNYGLDKGLSVSLYGINNDFVSLTLHQCKGETCLVNYKVQQYEWLAATQVFYHHLKNLLNRSQLIDKNWGLTRREIQCLSLTAKGFRLIKIAEFLGISTRTVEFHLQNANKKLGTNNKYLSAFKAKKNYLPP